MLTCEACQPCPNGLFRAGCGNASSGQCVAICPPGTLPNTTSSYCHDCHPRCATCVGSPERCTSCQLPTVQVSSNISTNVTWTDHTGAERINVTNVTIWNTTLASPHEHCIQTRNHSSSYGSHLHDGPCFDETHPMWCSRSCPNGTYTDPNFRCVQNCTTHQFLKAPFYCAECDDRCGRCHTSKSNCTCPVGQYNDNL